VGQPRRVTLITGLFDLRGHVPPQRRGKSSRRQRRPAAPESLLRNKDEKQPSRKSKKRKRSGQGPAKKPVRRRPALPNRKPKKPAASIRFVQTRGQPTTHHELESRLRRLSDGQLAIYAGNPKHGIAHRIAKKILASRKKTIQPKPVTARRPAKPAPKLASPPIGQRSLPAQPSTSTHAQDQSARPKKKHQREPPRIGSDYLRPMSERYGMPEYDLE
jgi:hypothetical protein